MEKIGQYERTCLQCNKEYKAIKPEGKFCSDACRGKHFRQGKRALNGTHGQTQLFKSSTPKPVKSEPTLAPAINAEPIFTGLAPHMQIAVNLLQKESKRWEDSFKEERTKRKKLEDEINTLKDKVRNDEHRQALEGLENEKPSAFERVLGSIPAPIMEQIAPVLGQLLSRVMTPQNALQMGGVEGQLDAQGQLIGWLTQLPEPLMKGVMGILAKLQAMTTPEELHKHINQINNLLTNGTTINQTERMYGT